MSKFILWGCGTNSWRILNQYCIPLKDIEMVVDADEGKVGTDFFGKEIKPPKQILEGGIQSSDVVVGTSIYFDDVLRMLKDMGWRGQISGLNEYVAHYPRSEDVTSDYNYEKHEKHAAEELVKLVQCAGAIRQDQMKEGRLLANRIEGIKRLPKGGKVAEVGVAYGDFSDILLNTLEPDHFYAIDYFNKDNPYIQMWGRQELVESGLTHEEWYRQKYKERIGSGKMTVCSGLSWECLSKFEDDFFDMIYVDASHDYDSIKRDTELVVRKTKHGGIIQFNDYTIWDVLAKVYYEVVPVVNKMIKDTNSSIIFYCLSPLGFSDVTVRLNKQ